MKKFLITDEIPIFLKTDRVRMIVLYILVGNIWLYRG